MAMVYWTRSVKWRQSQAMAQGKTVSERSGRELTPKDLTAIPEDLRTLFIRDGTVLTGPFYGIYVPILEPDRPSLEKESGLNYAFAEFAHDGDDLTSEDLVRVLRATIRAAQEAAAEERANAARIEKLAQEYRTALSAYWAHDLSAIAEERVPKPKIPDGLPFKYADEIEEEFKDRSDALFVYNAQKAREAKERQDAEVREWIEKHGSPRLKGLMREGIEWERVYRDERLALERPGWAWASRVCGTAGEIHGTSVTEAMILALEAVRKAVPDARLAWLGEGRHVSDCDCPEDEDEGVKCIRQRPVFTAEFLGREILREVEIEDVK